MKGKIIATLAVLMMVSAIENSIAQERKFFASFSFGMNAPVLTLSKTHQPGYIIAGSIGVKTKSNLGVGVNVEFNLFNPKNKSYYFDSDFQFSTISVNGFFLFKDFESKSAIVPFGMLGVGFNYAKLHPGDTRYGWYYPGTNYGDPYLVFNLGGGVAFRTSDRSEFFIEPTLTGTGIFPTETMFFSVKGGVRLEF